MVIIVIKRYTSPKMDEIWNDHSKFQAFLDVELASLKAYAFLGIVPKSDYEKIYQNATFDVNKIYELEAITKHDVIAFTRCVSLSLGEEKRWFHYGLTSTDVIDTANSLLLKKANVIIEHDIHKLLTVIKEKAYLYQNTPCIGRTHGMHAEVTSFGLKWVLWYDELMRNYIRFQNARKDLEVVKLSGAVGNFASIPMEVEEEVAKILDLGVAKISTQVLSRDRHAAYIFSLAQIASTLEKMATEVRHLSRTEVHEVEEFFDAGQKGSSAMPHKRNPIASENICGCSRMIRSYVNVALENNNLWHERDISHSSTERIIFVDATTLIDYMLTRFTKVLEKLVVYPEQMLENINLTYGIVFSGRVLSALINKGLSREEAYDLIQPLSFKSFQEKISFKKLLEESTVSNYLSKQEINDCFELEFYMKNVKKIYERVGL